MSFNSLIYITYYFGTFTYGRLQQREKSARREGHPCLRFVHYFVSVVFDTRKSCGWCHFSTKRTVMRPLRGQNFLRGSQALKYCFDLYSSRLYLDNLVLALRPSCYTLFTAPTPQRESKQGVPTVESQRFSLMPCCVLHRLETRTTGKSGLPCGTVASFNRFLGVPLFGAKIGGCTPFWRSPLFICCVI